MGMNPIPCIRRFRLGDVHPMKDGTRGGQFIQATLPGGKQVVRRQRPDENE